MTKLVEARDLLKTIALERGVKFSYMPIIIKATSLGLTQLPILNSSLDSNCEHIIYKANHNIGVAMDTPNGLVVPVIKVLLNDININDRYNLVTFFNSALSFSERAK